MTGPSDDRTLGRAFKLRRRPGSTAGIGDYIDKPEGMRWNTFERKMEQIEAAEAVCDTRLVRFVRQLGRRNIGRR